MKMTIEPTENGGRLISIDMRLGRGFFLVSANGNLLNHHFEVLSENEAEAYARNNNGTLGGDPEPKGPEEDI